MDTKELKKLHSKILEIAFYFDQFCQEHDITYYLMGGSALGAARHSGFIPWDDDFDVFMDYENYSKFLLIAPKKLDKKRFYFQKEDTKEWPLFFSKIRMNNTTFIEKELVNKDMHQGIYIDIMCLNNTSNVNFVRRIQYLVARILSAGALTRKGYSPKTKTDSLLLYVARYLTSGPLKKILLWLVRSFNKKDTTLVGHFFGRAPFKKTSFQKSFLGTQRFIKFESLSLPVPQELEKYLEVRYGNKYMELPSEEEKAKFPSHAYIVDTLKSYDKYNL